MAKRSLLSERSLYITINIDTNHHHTVLQQVHSLFKSDLGTNMMI